MAKSDVRTIRGTTVNQRHDVLWLGLRSYMDDLFKATEFEDLPHDAWLENIIVIDRKGDVVGRGYSVRYLQYEARRLQAEARRNADRREWRVQLSKLTEAYHELKAQQRPVGHLDTLLREAGRCVESGVNSLSDAVQHDTVVRAIREVEKEIDRIRNTEATEVLLSDLLGGKIRHCDLAYNQELLKKLRMYELRSGGAYTAPTKDQVEAHYRRRIQGLTTERQLLATDLKLEDEEEIVLELIEEGEIELAPETVQAPGNKGLSDYPVTYGMMKENGEEVPVGIITISQSAYDRHGAGYGQASKFPSLPFGIKLLIRVRVKIQSKELLSDPRPDGKPLQNEVARCQARLRNPKEDMERPTAAYLIPLMF